MACALTLASWQANSADQRLCRQLEAELASARSPARTRRLDGAIATQQDQLRIAGRRALRSGCGIPLLGRRSTCAVIEAGIEEMGRNLVALQRQRDRTASGAEGSRAAIMAALDANGCLDGGRPAGPDLDGVLPAQATDEAIPSLGGSDHREDAGGDLEQGADRVRRTLRPDGVLGPEFFLDGQPRELRTVCVRTCDGYFFPMSSASSRGDFARDGQNCQSACPGAEMLVYYHRLEGEEPKDMISAAADVPYAELPTAWLFRKAGARRPRGCGCSRPAPGFEVIAGDGQSAAPRPEAAAPAQPAPPPASGSPAKKVRVVGPAFLPDPEGPSGPPVPAPKEDP
jgi:hypothetical protein